jgi:hypothetical protein
MTDLEFTMFKEAMKRRLKAVPFAYQSNEVFDEQAAYSRARIEKEGIPFERVMADIIKIR